MTKKDVKTGSWVAGPWGTCSVTCGGKGTNTRSYSCSTDNDDDCAGTKPQDETHECLHTEECPRSLDEMGEQGAGTNYCLNANLLTKTECKLYAESEGIPFGVVDDSDDFPAACLHFAPANGANKIYYNENPNGGTNINSSPICIVDEDSSTMGVTEQPDAA